jgi:3-oxoacyl-[acyl-carrier-protein] synthase-1
MSAGVLPVEFVDIPGLGETIRVPYYRIPDGASLFDPARGEAALRTVAREAVDAANLTPREAGHMPVFVGSSAFSVTRSESEYRAALAGQGARPLALPQIGFQHMAATLQETLGNHGDTFAFNSACTAAANALMSATRLIQSGVYEHALVVGFELANITTLTGFFGLQLIADAVRPFDAQRSGVVLGEGVGAVVLSAATVRERGIVMRAGAANVDPYSVTAANPDGSSIAAVQSALLAQARVSSADVQGIKSHGTASPLNDTGEAAGIRRVFPALPPICGLKPYVGHTLGACGVNELVLLAGALQRGFFPATPGFSAHDPALGVFPTRNKTGAAPGCYLLNYFGFGGHNTALLIEHRT